ncbi:MAG: hypothetical protein J0L86_07015 [Flavobacteriales bacterium]|nr:hypothetical protein [Flavobacteriales bacterium]
MKLTLKPHNRNEYPIGGVLIKSASPKVWLQEIETMNLSLNSVEVYAIPSSKANELYGCLVITNRRIDSIGKNSYLQLIDDALFLPEYATISPSIAPEEWESLFKGCRCIMLPEIGLFELKEALNWDSLLTGVTRINVKITTPSKGVFIPSQIKSVRYELSEEDLLKEIENPLSEEEIIEQLPFDMKKLLNGNQREVEKYLNYIEKHPEMAIKLGIPLDTLGTSRGNNWGEFNFGGGFLGNLFSGLNSGSSSRIGRWVTSKYFVSFLIVFFLGVIIYSIFSTSSDDSITKSVSAAQSTSVQNSDPQSKAILVAFLAIMTFLILKLIFTSSFSIRKEFNFRPTVILLVLLLIALMVLLYPIYKNEGFDSKLSIGILIFVGIVLYRVFNAEMAIFKNDE